MAFFCMAGAAQDGIDYVAEALTKGAVAIVADRDGEQQPSDEAKEFEKEVCGEEVCEKTVYEKGDWQASERLARIISIVDKREAALAESVERSAYGKEMLSVTVVFVENIRKTLAYASDIWYGHPSRELVTIGVTGTKGKTTTTYLIKSILENAGRRVGLIGTNEVIIGRKHLEAGNTTPDALLLQSLLRQMVREGLDTVVMEVSSQALKLHRTDGISFDYFSL